MADSKGQKPKGNEAGPWQRMLAEAASSNRVPDSSLLLLGRPGIGKRTLVNALLNHANPAAAAAVALEDEDGEEVKFKAAALDFSYFGARDPALPESEVNAPDFTCPAACSVFIVEDQKHEQLLLNRVQNLDLQYCVAVICLDLKAPWTMLEDLIKWLEMLRRLSSECLLKLPVQEQDRLRERVKSVNSKKTPKKGEEEGEDVAEVADGMAEMLYNLGIPLVVVGTRSDSQATAETAEVQSPVIEMHLRQACISYGATIIYTSVPEKGTDKTEKNVELMYNFLMHRLYSYNFEIQALLKLSSRDALFIPGGWDAEAKLDKAILEKSFESVVVPPVQVSTDADQNVETCETLEAFLLRAQGKLHALGGGSARRVSGSHANGTLPPATPNGTAAGADGGKNDAKNEALTSFFQNLLTKGGTPIPQPGAAPGTPSAGGASAAVPAAAPAAGAPAADAALASESFATKADAAPTSTPLEPVPEIERPAT